MRSKLFGVNILQEKYVLTSKNVFAQFLVAHAVFCEICSSAQEHVGL